MDITAHGAEVERAIIGGVDVVVRIHVQLGMDGFGQLRAGEDQLGTGFSFVDGHLDEVRVHIRGLIDLTHGTADQVDVRLEASGRGGLGRHVVRLLLLDLSHFQLDVDLLGSAGGSELAGDLVVASFLRQA